MQTNTPALLIFLTGCAKSFVYNPEPCTPVDGVTLDSPEMDGMTLRDFVAEVEGDYRVQWEGNFPVADTFLSFHSVEIDMEALSVCSKEDAAWGIVVAPIVSEWSATGDTTLQSGRDAYFGVSESVTHISVLGFDPTPEAWVAPMEAHLAAEGYTGPPPAEVATQVEVGRLWGGGIAAVGEDLPDWATGIAYATASERLETPP